MRLVVDFRFIRVSIVIVKGDASFGASPVKADP
jgi:hypothetical protein